jgi:DNA polymerase II small subunit
VSVSHANSSLSKAVNYAVSHGYQIAPDALKLLQQIAKNQDKRELGEPALDVILQLVIEEKVRATIGQLVQGSINTISVNDLIAIEPDLFEGLQTESEALATVTTVQEGNQQDVIVKENIEPKVEILRDPSDKIQPVGIEGFAQLFKSRYEKLMKILRERPEARHLSKISEIKEGESVRIAGLVYSKRFSKNGIELAIDDESGRLSLLALNDEAKRTASQVALDQCIMVELDQKGGRFFLKSLVQPDLPNRVVSQSKKTVYALFLSDLHIGSNKFLEEAFNRLLDWLSGRGFHAKEDEEIIKRLKYVILGGDIVDGVGVFPSQEYELVESNVYKQYEMVSKKLSSIPQHLSMFVIPGNHDSTRQALPQPMIPRRYAEPLYNLKNITMLGDPALIKLHGVSILIYHGRSLDDVLATTPGLSYERPTEAMKVLLKARHLAPTFGSRTPIAPEIEDHLVIDPVPDIFHAGHVHSVGVESYKGTLIVNSGTWQAQTGYQANLGIMPRPGLVPIVNLATLEVLTREFLTTYEPVATAAES